MHLVFWMTWWIDTYRSKDTLTRWIVGARGFSGKTRVTARSNVSHFLSVGIQARQAGNTFTKAQSHATASDHQCGRPRSCDGSCWGPRSNTCCSLVSRERLFRRAGTLRDQHGLCQLRDAADVHVILGFSGALVRVDPAALRISPW